MQPLFPGNVSLSHRAVAGKDSNSFCSSTSTRNEKRNTNTKICARPSRVPSGRDLSGQEHPLWISTGREVMEPSSPALPRRCRWCGRGSRSASRWVCQQSPSGAGPDTTGQGSGGDAGCSQDPHRCLPCRTGQTRSLPHTSSTAGS